MIRLIESEIRELKHRVLDMAELVRLQLENACVALKTQDHSLAQRVMAREAEIDELDNKIHKRCERIIALYQPVANDLRFVFSVLEINGYLEQIGDNVTGIVNKLQKFQHPLDPQLIADLRLEELQQLVRDILYETLRAFFRESSADARAIFAKDDAIDEINRAAFDIIVQRIQQDPARTADYIHLLNVVKGLEKIGDNAVAIAEEALFHTDGELYRHTDLKHAHRSGDGAGA